MMQGELAGFVEYHTQDITGERLEGLLRDLADGRLDHAGSWPRAATAPTSADRGPEALDTIIATGPKRKIRRLPRRWSTAPPSATT